MTTIESPREIVHEGSQICCEDCNITSALEKSHEVHQGGKRHQYCVNQFGMRFLNSVIDANTITTQRAKQLETEIILQGCGNTEEQSSSHKSILVINAERSHEGVYGVNTPSAAETSIKQQESDDEESGSDDSIPSSPRRHHYDSAEDTREDTMSETSGDLEGVSLPSHFHNLREGENVKCKDGPTEEPSNSLGSQALQSTVPSDCSLELPGHGSVSIPIRHSHPEQIPSHHTSPHTPMTRISPYYHTTLNSASQNSSLMNTALPCQPIFPNITIVPCPYSAQAPISEPAPLSGPIFRQTPPWIRASKSEQKEMSLHEEILAFCGWISPASAEKKMREDVILRVRQVVSDLWPSSEVKVFGSCSTGIYLPSSDIDLCIMGAWGASANNPLYELAGVLRRRQVGKHVQTIATARIPIVKMVDTQTGCLVDIQFDIPNGVANTAIIKKFLEEIPLVRPLALVLKYFLKQLGLNEPYTGGIGSYTLLIMIISYLQLHKPKEKKDQEDLGVLLLGFLKLYGEDFNYNHMGISIRDGGSYFHKAQRNWVDWQQQWMLSVEDPCYPENDVSKGSFAILEIRAMFARAYHILKSKDSKYAAPSLLCRVLLRDRQMEMHRGFVRRCYKESRDTRRSCSNNRMEKETTRPEDSSKEGKRERGARRDDRMSREECKRDINERGGSRGGRNRNERMEARNRGDKGQRGEGAAVEERACSPSGGGDGTLQQQKRSVRNEKASRERMGRTERGGAVAIEEKMPTAKAGRGQRIPAGNEREAAGKGEKSEKGGTTMKSKKSKKSMCCADTNESADGGGDATERKRHRIENAENEGMENGQTKSRNMKTQKR